MTRINYELHTAYDNAKEGRCGDRLQLIADTADEAAGTVLATFKEARVVFPNGDPMMNIELSIFQAALQAAGIDYRNLAFEPTVRKFETA